MGDFLFPTGKADAQDAEWHENKQTIVSSARLSIFCIVPDNVRPRCFRLSSAAKI
jgi:hypothetical protein